MSQGPKKAYVHKSFAKIIPHLENISIMFSAVPDQACYISFLHVTHLSLLLKQVRENQLAS